MKKKHLLAFLLFAAFKIHAPAQKYQISKVNYDLETTKEKAVRHKILIDTSRVFESETEISEYKETVLQAFENTRAFEKVEISFARQNGTDNSGLENEKVFLVCNIKAADSKHLLIVPYPKYDSNSGLTIKLKAKDTNFLGNLEDLNFDFSAGKKDSELSGENNFFLGASLDFSVPFYSGKFNVFWLNNYSFEYNFADMRPQFSSETGLSIELPFERFSLVFDIREGIYRDFEYTEFEDELYGKTYSKFSVPIKLFQSEKTGDFVFRPFMDFDFNYGKDTISKSNDDLSGGVFASGSEIEIGKIDWHGNFRNGYSFIAGGKYGYNLECNAPQYKIYAKALFFKTFKYNSLQARADFNMSDKYRIKIGENLRGIEDDQYYKGTSKRALKVPSSLTVNLDFPFHIVTTDWSGWIDAVFKKGSWISEHFQWTKTFDFELQIVPFTDFALSDNEATKRFFSTKDGWYSAGFEILVFPEKWKSVVVRASAGFDIGKLVLKEKFPEKIDYSWRENSKSHEIYIGIGLLY